MYNEEVKLKFLSEPAPTGTIDGRKKAFGVISRAESHFGKDICQMSRSEAIQALEIVVTYELTTTNSMVSCLKAYGKWCYNNGYFVDSPYGILGISASDISPVKYIKENIFLTESDLFREMGTVVPIHDGYIEVIAIAFAWMGIAEPVNVLDTDVDIANRKIYADGKPVVNWFSDFMYDFLIGYSRLKTSVRDNGTTTYEVVKDNSHNTFIKRFCTKSSNKMGKRIDLRTIQSAINKMNVKYEENGGIPKFSYRNIMRSGSLNRLYVAEQNGLDVFNSGNAEIVENVFGNAKYRNIVWIYRNYKEAFNL